MEEEIFRYILADRIDDIRATFEIDETFQIKGMRFNDTNNIVEAIQGAIIMRKDPSIKGSILKEVLGLEYSVDQVLDGKFDPLIRIMLKHTAAMDYEGEHRVDLN